MSGITALIKVTPEISFTPLLPCEDTVKRLLSMKKKAGPHQTLNLLGACLRIPRLQNGRKYISVVYNPPSLSQSVIAA